MTRHWPGVVMMCMSVILTTGSAGAQEKMFAEPVKIATGVAGVTSLAVGDLNGDGRMDLVVAEGGRHGEKPTFAWFAGPDWKRHEFNPKQAPGPFTGDCKLADVDGDGRLDIVVSSDQHSGKGKSEAFWYRNPGGDATGVWQRTRIAEFANAPHIGDLDVADIDGDGKIDVVARHLGERRVQICFQDAPDRWTARSLEVRDREGLELADMDGDGRIDIVLNGFWWATPAEPRAQAFEELVIDEIYFKQMPGGLNNSTKAGFADIDGDGRMDVIFSTCEGAKGALAWYRRPEKPREQPWEKHVIEELTGNHQVIAVDVDGDGDIDIIGGMSFGQKGVFVWLNEGKGKKWKKITVTTKEGMYSGVAADLDGDGDIDFVGPTTYSNGSVPLFYENRTRQ